MKILSLGLILSLNLLFACKTHQITDVDLLEQRELFIFPVSGYISSPFGWQPDPITDKYRFHTGIDLSAKIDTPVKAAMAGIVTETGNSQMYGNYIIIGHGNSYHTLYAHLSAVSIKQGDHVVQGNTIGKVGNTGYSTGSYLHFGIYKDGKVVNPSTARWDAYKLRLGCEKMTTETYLSLFSSINPGSENIYRKTVKSGKSLFNLLHNSVIRG